jgi:hypothetical protein
MFFGRSRATWIQLDPLTYSSVASLVSRTLRQSKDNVAPLSRLIHRISAGNAFSVRNLLTTLQRQHLVSSERVAAMALAELYEADNVQLGWQLLAVSFKLFSDWLDQAQNHHRYEFPEIEKILLSQKLAVDPNDISYLTSHLKKLPVDARKFLVWASCFGAT